MKAALARLGIRGFNLALRKAAERLDELRTPEGGCMPARALAEMRRDMVRFRFIEEQIAEIERERLRRLEDGEPRHSPTNAMVRLLSRVVGLGVETADMLVHEIFARDLRDRRAVARYAGLTGSPDESGSRRRERAGTARHGPTGLALPGLPEGQRPGSVVSRRTADGRGRTRMAMIVALARKLLIALWRMVKTGEIPEGVRLRIAAPADAR